MLKFSSVLIVVIYVTVIEGFFIRNDSRIAAGIPAAKGENLDWVHLTVVFQNQMQMCGGVLAAKDGKAIVTSASCVFDPVEGEATIVTVTPAGNPKLVANKLAITVHPEFALTEGVYTNNIAIVYLDKPITPDEKTIKVAKFDETAEDDTFINKAARVCGLGSTANAPTPPKGLMCTDLFVVPFAECNEEGVGITCTKWSDRENNICNGDYGGPLYLNVYDAKGVVTSSTVIGISSYSMDRRTNAPCLDGHKVEFTTAAALMSWVKAADPPLFV